MRPRRWRSRPAFCRDHQAHRRRTSRMWRSDRAVTIEQPWTDWTGRRHARMVGRPISIHAMRGISAYLQRLPHLPRAAICCRCCSALSIRPARSVTNAVSEADPARHRAAGPAAPNTPLAGPPPVSRRGLRICWSMPREPLRIDKAFSWEAPLAAHGMLHTVIANAHAGDPYPIDTLFPHGEYELEFRDNTAETMRMFADKNPETGDYRIPRIIYSDAYYSEMARVRRSRSARHDLSRAVSTASRCSTGRSATPTARPTLSASRCWRRTATCGRSRMS